MHATMYLTKILKNHGWECCSKDEEMIIEPLHPNSMKELELTLGPDLEAESKQLEADKGFSHREAIGELIFRHAICCPDIGYAVAKSSEFSTSPAKCHYKVVKCMYCYFQRTKDWGLINLRQEPHMELPEGKHTRRPSNETDLFLLGLKRKINLEFTLMLHMQLTSNVAAIAYSAKWQIPMTTSLTEAEFVHTVSAAKMAKYLCTVLNELGITHHGPTMFYKDNAAAIMMVNANKPNDCTWHIRISYFALQEWVQEGK
eukprot:12424459-Ditylum_brightwellii.AAC.1